MVLKRVILISILLFVIVLIGISLIINYEKEDRVKISGESFELDEVQLSVEEIERQEICTGDITGENGDPDGIVDNLDLENIEDNLDKNCIEEDCNGADITGLDGYPDGVVDNFDIELVNSYLNRECDDLLLFDFELQEFENFKIQSCLCSDPGIDECEDPRILYSIDEEVCIKALNFDGGTLVGDVVHNNELLALGFVDGVASIDENIGEYEIEVVIDKEGYLSTKQELTILIREELTKITMDYTLSDILKSGEEWNLGEIDLVELEGRVRGWKG